MENIVITDLSKSYGGTQVFSAFSAVIEAGAVTSIMGQSGCGKTTLLRLIMGLEKPDGGSINGVPEKISAVFQEDRLCPQLSAVDNIALVTGRRYSRGEIEHELRAVGISDDLNKPVSQFSGGMQRRVALVRAMMAEADLLVLDEPFKGLDDDTRAAVIEYVMARRKGRTLLHVTHSLSDAEALGGKILKLGD